MENYTIYKFTFSDGKTYIGQTKEKVEDRWREGEGYKGQDVYVPIVLEGWENIKKEILHTNLTLEQANELEKHYIKKFNSIKKGYNKNSGGNNNGQKTISINIDEEKILNFIKQCIKDIKPTTLKLLLYFIFNNNNKIVFHPSEMPLIIGISERTARTCFKELVDSKIILSTNKSNEFTLTA